MFHVKFDGNATIVVFELLLGVDPTSLRPVYFAAETSHQILARLWNGADVHRLPVDGVDEASLGHGDGTDDVDPAGCGVTG